MDRRESNSGSGRRWGGVAVAAAVVMSGWAAAPSLAADADNAGDPAEETTTGVLAWGMNRFGQQGQGASRDDVTVPTAVPVNGTVASVARGQGFHSVAVLDDGTVQTWGANFCGQLGNGTVGQESGVPTALAGLPAVVEARTGGCHSVALAHDGTVWAWGANASGQVGGVLTGAVTAPVQVAGLSQVTQVSAGGFHSAAVDEEGRLWTWGNNAAGQLGRPTAGAADFAPGVVAGLDDVRTVANGGGFSVVLRGDGTVWGFGANNFGQLGAAAPMFAREAAQIAGLSDIVDIAAGRDHTLAVRADGTLWTLGYNNHGQLGNGTTTESNVPIQVALPGRVTAIAEGGFFSLAVTEDGALWAWGANGTGQLGDGTRQDRHVPTRVQGITAPRQVAGAGEHSLALVELSRA